jgi:hypothetical protein
MPSGAVISSPIFQRAEVEDVRGQPADRGPVALRVFEQRRVLRDPDVAAIALEPLVENAGRRLPPLPCPGAIAEEEAGAVELAVRGPP